MMLDPRQKRTTQVDRFVLLLALAITAMLAACSDTTPAPETVETSSPRPTIAPSLTPEDMPAETPLPVSTATPERNTANTPLPANTPAPEGTEAPLRATSEPEALPPASVITPLNLGDSEAALSRVSNPEISCLKQAASPGRLHEILRGVRVPVPEEEAWIVACLEDETLFGVFVAMLIGDPGPLSQDTSTCLRTGLEWVDHRELMTEDTRDRGQDDRAGAVLLSVYFTAVACLNQEEWDATAAGLGLNPGDQETFRCFIEAVGGPETLATALEEADDDGSVDLNRARLGCGLFFEGTSEHTQAETPPAPPAPSTPTPTALTGPPPSTETTTLIITVAEVPAGIPEYNRSEWRHWIDEDGDCQDARQEVLVVESLVEVTYEDDRQCRVATGQWWAPHLGHHLENPGHLDVDTTCR